MSELRDTVAYFDAIERKFDEIDARDTGQDRRILELEKFAAALDRSQKTIDNQIEIFREAIKNEFDRLRKDLGIGRK